jgi:hypothetical protein
MNTLDVDEILEALRNHDIDVVLNNMDKMIMSCIDYIPYEYWKQSQTIKKMCEIRNLSSEELDKLADIYERSIINCEFVHFYELNTLNKQYIIAEHIINYDRDFWKNKEGAFENLINELKNDFGDSVVDNIVNNNNENYMW